MHHNGIQDKLFWGIERAIDLSEITSFIQLYILSYLSRKLGLNEIGSKSIDRSID